MTVFVMFVAGFFDFPTFSFTFLKSCSFFRFPVPDITPGSGEIIMSPFRFPEPNYVQDIINEELEKRKGTPEWEQKANALNEFMDRFLFFVPLPFTWFHLL